MNSDQKYKLAVIEIILAFIVAMFMIYGDFSHSPESFSFNLESANFQVEMNCEFDK